MVKAKRHHKIRRYLIGIVVVFILVWVAAHLPNASPTTTPGSGTDGTGAGVSADTGSSAALDLTHLRIAPLGDPGGYTSDAFGQGWDKQPDGCDTRDDVLARDARPGTLVRHGCKVVGGVWVSPYDGRTVTSPRQLQIDHIVPKKFAWDDGANTWSPAKRVLFANDMSELFAVTVHENESKGEKTPPQWEPPANRCWYAQHLSTVQIQWGLPFSDQEARALAAMCGER